MIHLQDVTKAYYTSGHRKVVADGITFTIPDGMRLAVLGRNGAGKSTLLKMIAGTLEPDSGIITTTGTVSWPVGFAGSFHAELTGAQNVRFIARVYGVDTDELIDFVEEFAGLGDYYHLPFRVYSSGMRAKLAFGVSMGIRFDTYLVDESTAVGDAAFRAKSHAYFLDRVTSSGAVFVSHALRLVRSICDCGVVLENGRFTFHDDIDTAVDHHNDNMGSGRDTEDYV
jgi:capsular polysaccharide transport system ATP-binding protein